MTFYRDSNQKEIDLIVEENGILHPIEIKLAGSPDHKVIKAFDVLKATTSTKGRGAVICMTKRVFPIDADNCMVPCNII